MPYDSYTKLSDADISALWAFIRALPPVRRAARPNTLHFPMNLRPGVAVWQAAYFQPGRLAPVAGKSAEWNRGAYLVEALGHCGDCHTPRNFAMAADQRQRLAGARVESWYAPDIGSDALARLTGRSVDELVAYLKTGHGPGNVTAAGPMREVIDQSLSHLTEPDLRAMAVYLADQPDNATQRRDAAQPPDAPQLAAGKAVYDEQCASCHQATGTGASRVVPALAGDPGVTAREPVNVVTAVLEGFDPQGSWGAMPSFAGVLDDDRIAAVTNYVRNSWGNRGERAATAWSVAALRAVAQTPPGGTRAALQCPLLAFDVMQPAMRAGTLALQASARNPALLARLVHDYQAARPRASGAQVIEALSAAYCRVLTAGPSTSATQTARTTARANAALPEYSQQVARLLYPGVTTALPATAASAATATATQATANHPSAPPPDRPGAVVR
jgi:mono/diheme cytochrome c family protein